MKGTVKYVCAVAALGLVALTGTPAMAARFDVTFYELTETATFDTSTGIRTGAGSLAGEAKVRKSPLCPRALVDFLVAADLMKAGHPCYVTAEGSDTIDAATGAGTFAATIDVKVQLDNAVDAPEFVVLMAEINGSLQVIDLEGRLIQITGGSLTVTWRLDAGPLVSDEPLTGMIRLPFVVDPDGHSRKPRRWERAFYLSDGGRPFPVEADELSLGLATARFELNFEGRFE